MQIGLAGEIGRRDALLDPEREALAEERFLARSQPGIGEGVEIIDRQMKALEDEERRLIQRGGRAVAVMQVGGAERADSITQGVAER